MKLQPGQGTTPSQETAVVEQLRATLGRTLDLSGLLIHFDPAAPSMVRAVHDTRSVALAVADLAFIERHISQFRAFRDGLLKHVLFADNGWTAVYRGPRTICAFRLLPLPHLVALRALAETSMPAGHRSQAGISGSDTTLQLAALHGCHGRHTRACPPSGSWPLSVVQPNGSVDKQKLAMLRGRRGK